MRMIHELSDQWYEFSSGQINEDILRKSVIGPILITLYVNRMQNASTLELCLFSDNAHIFNFEANFHTSTRLNEYGIRKAARMAQRKQAHSK